MFLCCLRPSLLQPQLLSFFHLQYKFAEHSRKIAWNVIQLKWKLEFMLFIKVADMLHNQLQSQFDNLLIVLFVKFKPLTFTRFNSESFVCITVIWFFDKLRSYFVPIVEVSFFPSYGYATANSITKEPPYLLNWKDK